MEDEFSERFARDFLSSDSSRCRTAISGAAAATDDVRMAAFRNLAQFAYADSSAFQQFLRIRIDFGSNEQILKDYLLHVIAELHDSFIKCSNFESALRLELHAYSNFIKQSESVPFYEFAFDILYRPYRKLSSRKNKGYKSLESILRATRTIFLFHNLNPLAHVKLFIEQVEEAGVTSRADWTVFSLFPVADRTAAGTIQGLGIDVVEAPANETFLQRFQRLVAEVKARCAHRVVFVSTPLHAPYVSRLLPPDVEMVWWSHKFALNCVPYFDRFVCFRSLSRRVRVIDGTEWLCSPLALEMPNRGVRLPSISGQPGLKLGVLAREEKIASSNLPEILGQLLADRNDLSISFTARGSGESLRSRILKRAGPIEEARLFCAGWVVPSNYLATIDVLVDTPNLGGLSCYWAMAFAVPVISAFPNGSIAALSDEEEIRRHFTIIDSKESWFRLASDLFDRPFVLRSFESDLMGVVIKSLQCEDSRKRIGLSFREFFKARLSDKRSSALAQLELIGAL